MSNQLSVAPIQASSKGELKRLRKSGYVPISVQHRGEETLHLMCEAKRLKDFIAHHGETALIELQPKGGQALQAILHGIQRDPVSRDFLQVTFQKVVRGEKVKAHVPITLVGEPGVVHEHTAMVDQPLAEVEVRCDPADLPDHLTVDVSGLELGGAIRVADLQLPQGVEMLSAEDGIVASVVTLLKPDEALDAEPVSEDAAADDGAGGDSESDGDQQAQAA
jgi:large subunit ribosomal protein L25